jgi:hypothetical protein
MKTLRLLRNIAALFIFGAALLVPRPTEAASPWICGSSSLTVGLNCFIDSNGVCNTQSCISGQPCNNSKCYKPIIAGTGGGPPHGGNF